MRKNTKEKSSLKRKCCKKHNEAFHKISSKSHRRAGICQGQDGSKKDGTAVLHLRKKKEKKRERLRKESRGGTIADESQRHRGNLAPRLAARLLYGVRNKSGFHITLGGGTKRETTRERELPILSRCPRDRVRTQNRSYLKYSSRRRSCRRLTGERNTLNIRREKRKTTCRRVSNGRRASKETCTRGQNPGSTRAGV